RLDGTLASLGVPHFLHRFDGAHEWAPASVWPEALAWMSLHAMKTKRMPPDEGFVATELQRFTDAAREVEKSGNVYFAAQTYRQTAAAFEGLAATDTLRERTADLEKNPWYHTGEKRERDELSTEASLENEIYRVTSGLRDQSADRAAVQQQ